MPETTTELARAAPMNPIALLQAAVERGMDADQLSKLIDLQERWELNAAAGEYARAMAAFQAEMPPVVKGRAVENKGGGTRFKFAGFEDIMVVAAPLLAKHGISLGFSQTLTDTDLVMTMRVRVGKHFEDKAFAARLPNVPQIAQDIRGSEAQGLGVVSSYFKRYCLVNGLNLVVVGEDNDAALKLGAAEVDQVWHLINRLEKARKPIDLEKFLKWVGAPTVSGILRGDYEKVTRELKGRLAAAQPQEAAK